MTLKSFIGNLKAWVSFAPTSRPRKVLQKTLIYAKAYLTKHPRLKRILLNMLDTMPILKQKLQNIGRIPQASIHFNTLTTEEQLSPQAKEIFAKFRKKINDNQGNQ